MSADSSIQGFVFLNKSLHLVLILILSTALSGYSYQSQTLLDSMNERYGDEGGNTLLAWFDMIDSNRNTSPAEQMEAVNTFFNNRIRYTSDLLIWKKSDYWASPLETMGNNAGDCEDFTIAKYMSLLELGIEEEKLRLIYVRATIPEGGRTRIEAHMVLGYYSSPNSVPLILDSLIPSIKVANDRKDLKPIYSFNREGLWVGSIESSRADPTTRLSPWRDVLQRMKMEGF